MKNLIQLLIVAALAGIGLRNFESGNYQTAAFAGAAIVAVGTLVIIRVRNQFDKKALSN